MNTPEHFTFSIGPSCRDDIGLRLHVITPFFILHYWSALNCYYYKHVSQDLSTQEGRLNLPDTSKQKKTPRLPRAYTGKFFEQKYQAFNRIHNFLGLFRN